MISGKRLDNFCILCYKGKQKPLKKSEYLRIFFENSFITESRWQVESGIKDLGEWASEGESKRVDETERTLRYQIRHMTVCNERIREVSSRVAPQKHVSLLSQQRKLGTEAFFFCPSIKRKRRKHHEREQNPLQDLPV